MKKQVFKIVYVIPLLSPYFVQRCIALSKIPNVEVYVIAEINTSDGRTGWKYKEIEGCHTYLLNSKLSKPYYVKHKKDNYVIKQVRTYPFGLRRKLKQIQPHVVLVCNSVQLAFSLGLFRTYKVGIVVEDTLRAAEGRKKINAFIKKQLLKRADVYLPYTHDAEEFLSANGIRQPYVRTSWSIEIEFFSDLREKNMVTEMKEKLGIHKKKNYILVASLIQRKGIIPFLEGWKEMNDSFHEKSALYILGDGPLKSEIQSYIDMHCLNNVNLLGNLPYKMVSHYLQCGDVFVLPTLEDLCSLSVLEAMASGLPILTTIYNGAREFVKEGVNGYIFDPQNIESIKAVLNSIDKADLVSFSEASSKIIEDYSTERVQKRLYTDLYAFCGGQDG